MKGMKLCHCGQPLHYSNPETQALVERMIEERGEMIDVTVTDRTWRVPRHFIALHGLQAAEVERLGFEEITHLNGKAAQ